MSKSPERLALDMAVANYAKAAASVLVAFDNFDEVSKSPEHRLVVANYPHQKSMSDVLSDILAWRDSLEADSL